MKVSVNIAGKKPTVLRSRQAWFTWKSNFGSRGYGTDVWDTAPSSFPCLAYTVLDTSENESPHYIYSADIDKMAAALEKASK